MKNFKQLLGDNRTILAPMAGYTDVAFRSICRDYGASLTVTEMVSSKALVMGNKNALPLLAREPNDNSTVVQIFGHEPDVMAESVQLPCLRSFDAVDINMGCPVRKIVSNGDGSALLENPTLASKIITTVKNALGSKPLSVKFRLGVSDQSVAVNFAKMCADSGADLITVHFRTRSQMYAGKADYTLLPQITKCGIPVIANGDICNREDFLRLTEMGAYGVAVGRGALGSPWVFSQIANQNYSADICTLVHRHANTLLRYYDSRVVANEMKKHVAFYLKGMRNAKNVVTVVNNAHSLDCILQCVDDFLQGEYTND